MHEMSLMQSLLKIVEQKAKEKNSTKVLSISISVGALSGVEPDLLSFAFDSFSDGTCAKGAKFFINKKPLVIHCKHCGVVESGANEYLFQCPKCKSDQISIPENDELLIEKMELEIENECDGL